MFSMETRKVGHRTPRFYFPLFKVVQFQNDVCLTSEGLSGTCYTRTECTILRGRSVGLCAKGFGVCCFWDNQCGGEAIRNRSYFMSPNWRKPFNEEQSCELIIKKPAVAEGICLLRLNFRYLELAPPVRGRCSTDAFRVPHSSKLPVLCGNNTGHHTPAGCLQYYTGAEGSISTFNSACAPPYLPFVAGRKRRHVQYYINGHKRGTKREKPIVGLNVSLVAQNDCLLGGLDYSICVRIESQMCAIQWLAVVFDMGADGVTGAARGDVCQQNYIGLAGGFSSTSMARVGSQGKTFDRFCGRYLNTEPDVRLSVPITSHQKPIVTRVKSAPTFFGPFRGAQLNFVQRICV
ncbi:hypothetical protein HDE_13519 [Halotydeus destructor]|nr:hypothetical protein HDE_13519 [Halotydeus destructor]